MIEGARASEWGRRTGVTVALLLLAFGLRLGNRALFYDLFPDKIRQIAAAGNLLRGRGISDCWADPADLARVTCHPQTDWPAGYPIMSAAITKLSGDFIVTDAIIDAMALALVLLAAGSLIRRFRPGERSNTAYRWFLVFSAISFAPYVYLTTTDLFSLALYLTAAAVALRIAERPPALAASAAAGTLLWLAAVTRYNYVPLLACVPITFALVGILRRDGRLFRSAATCVAVALVLSLALRLSLPRNGALLPHSAGGGGWYPGNLRSLDPFAFKAFFYLDPVLSRLSRSIPWLDSAVLLAAQPIALLLVAGSATWALTGLGRQGGADQRPLAIFMMVTLAVTVAALAWLSLRVAPENQPYDHRWTYLWETRYYAPFLLLLVPLAFALASSPTTGGSAALVRGARVTVGSAVVYAVAFDLWIMWTLVGRHDLSRTSFAQPTTAIRVAHQVRHLAASEDRPVVVAFPSVGEAYAAGRLRDFDFGTVRASRPVVLLVIASADSSRAGRVQAWLDSARARPLVSRRSKVLYRVDVGPTP